MSNYTMEVQTANTENKQRGQFFNNEAYADWVKPSLVFTPGTLSEHLKKTKISAAWCHGFEVFEELEPGANLPRLNMITCLISQAAWVWIPALPFSGSMTWLFYWTYLCFIFHFRSMWSSPQKIGLLWKLSVWHIKCLTHVRSCYHTVAFSD